MRKKLILTAVFLLTVLLCVLPAQAEKTGMTSFAGVAGNSYNDTFATYSGNLEDAEASVSHVKGGCINQVSAYTKQLSDGSVRLYLRYTCVKAGTSTLDYHFTYSINGEEHSYVWETTVKVTAEETVPEEDDDDDDEEEEKKNTAVKKPTVTKDPTGERVEEGGSCSFVARAEDADEIVWYMTDGETTIRASRAKNTFSGLKVSGADEEKLKLSNIPAEMDGWKIYARFINGAGHTNSKRAQITVEADEPFLPPSAPVTATPAAMQAYTYVPASAVTAAPSPTAPVTATPSPTATPHVHMFPAAYSYDANGHWHVCACGESTAPEAHELTWRTVREASSNMPGLETAACAKCGYVRERETVYAGGNSSLTAVAVLGVLLTAALVVIAVLLVKRPA